MEILSIIFSLGVTLAIFSFIWGLFNICLSILRGGLPLNYPAKLMMKAIQYFLIVDVVVLFGLDKGELNLRNAIITGAIIGMYFLGKVQQMKMSFAIISIQGRNFNKPTKPNMPMEFGLIIVALMFYVFFLFNTDLAANSVAQWFYTSIVDIEKTIFFGFIFKVIGVIFTITMIFRMLNSINVIITRKSPTDNFNDRNKQDDDRFDDYEEVK